ncbi:hypothetical protein [Thauera sp. 2A1]|uniref:hypothetical protein n=1 Tax=Thauera sp. 2A1 TaxID=2570191 RepID=UPI001292A13C|nr:hypothetical protein [Thauera sp. 2A1]KAI5914629.1 hypothetical protein GH664_11830 [Thauera sp. 2A1]
MALTWKCYADPGLTVELTTLDMQQATSGAPADAVIYFGSVSPNLTLQAASAPGTDPIAFSIIDANAGTGLPATAIRLALSYAGLASATPGAALNIGTTLSSGAANKVAIYVRATSGSSTPATFTDLSLQTSLCVEA